MTIFTLNFLPGHKEGLSPCDNYRILWLFCPHPKNLVENDEIFLTSDLSVGRVPLTVSQLFFSARALCPLPIWPRWCSPLVRALWGVTESTIPQKGGYNSYHIFFEKSMWVTISSHVRTFPFLILGVNVPDFGGMGHPPPGLLWGQSWANCMWEKQTAKKGKDKTC